MTDPFDDPDFQAYLRRTKEQTFPKIKESAVSITIAPGEEPDPKICLEMGAMIFYDKPIVVFVPPGRKVPNNLKRVASAIIEGEPSDPATRKKFEDTLDRIFANDKRARN